MSISFTGYVIQPALFPFVCYISTQIAHALITQAKAIKLLLILIGIVVLFHVCILIQLIPYQLTWGGKLQHRHQMYVFESIAIAVNFLLALVLGMKGQHIKPFIPIKAVNVILWLFIILFVLNTLGNLLAETYFEKSFALITFVSAALLVRILFSK